MNLGDPEFEFIDPTPNIHALFIEFDRIFFWTKLASRAVVRWSKRMYSWAGVCSYERQAGLCSITLSEPLLKLRPRKDLVETLLHEMIHAYLFITQRVRDRDGHGPNFKEHMFRINMAAGINITIYHDFHDEPKQDLQNYYYKTENKEPKLKPTAKLRNIPMKFDSKMDTSDEIHEDPELASTSESELAKLILGPQTETQRKKRKYDYIGIPASTSGSKYPDKVSVAIQATDRMTDKATNTNFKPNKIRNMVNTQFSEQHLSSLPLEPDSASLFSFASESEASEDSEVEVKRKEYIMRKMFIETMYKKPKMYLGLPHQYLWLIDFIVKKSPHKIDALCIIVTLLKIKQNDSIERISDELEISRTKLTALILQGIEALASFFQNFIVSPLPMEIKKNLPLVFKIRYSNVQMIMDCFEIQICKSSDPLRQAQTWSQYKGSNTVKYLIGCTPNGLVSFISIGFGGRVSDKAMVERSGVLDVLHDNAVVLADRGFKEIECQLNARGMKLLRPPSVYSGTKLTADEVKQSKVVASLRVHVERVIRRVREF